MLGEKNKIRARGG